MEIDHSLNHDPKLTRVTPTLIHKTHGVPTKRSMITTHLLPSAPSIGWTGMFNDRDNTCQCTLVGNTLDNEQWTNGLSNLSLL